MTIWRMTLAVLGLPALLACKSEVAQTPDEDQAAASAPEPVEAAPPELTGDAGEPEQSALGTPMEQRVATLGLLNKRNNIARDIEIMPGQSRRIDDVELRLAACERTAPWEDPAETGAFVQVLVAERAAAGEENRFRQVFSGWLFKNSPSLNVVEHPIYDVWVKDCAMSFPGEEDVS